MMELFDVVGRQVLRVMVGRVLSHIPDIPSNMLGIYLLPIRSLIRFHDYLRGRYILLDLGTTKVSDLHSLLDSRHIYSPIDLLEIIKFIIKFDGIIIIWINEKVNSFLEYEY